MAGRRDVRLAGGSVPCLSWVGLWAGGGVIGEPTFFFLAMPLVLPCELRA